MAEQKYKYNIGCGGYSLSAIVFVVFLVLKLCGVLDWSWWWVTSPIWITVGVGSFYLLIILIAITIADRIRIQQQ